MNGPGIDTRLFEAKIRIPRPANGVLARRRLYAQLNAAADCKLILISAPAGFGKTTLVSSWLRERAASPNEREAAATPFRAAWLSLDERENNLAAFIGHLVGAIRYAAKDLDFEATNLLQLPTMPPVSELARALVADIARFDEDVLLVLDDYHLIHEPSIHALLEMLLAYSPDQFRLIVIGRYDPPLPIARLTLQGRARVIRANDLRFRREEAESYLESATPPGLPHEALEAVAEQAAGWIAQLRLAAITMQHEPGPSMSDSARDLAMDYLMQELLTSEAPEVRAFLLATSILERFCGPLVDALLGPPTDGRQETCPALVLADRHRPAEVLKRVVRLGLFVNELDSTGTWYRYHDLFREMLFQRLQSECGGDLVVLRRRAFDWLKAAGLVEEALAQARAAGDDEAAADLVAAHILDAVQRFEWQSVQRWLDAVTPEAIRLRPALLLAQGYCLTNMSALERLGKIIAWAEQTLQDARIDSHERIAGDRNARIWSGALDVLRSEHAFATNQIEASRLAAQRALTTMPQDRVLERGFAAIRLASVLSVRGTPDEARAVLRSALADATDERAPWVARVRLSLAITWCREGDLKRAGRELEMLGRVTAGNQPYNDCWVHYGLGRFTYEWNDLEVAEGHFRAASRSHGGNYARAFEACLGLALTLQVRGDHEGADRAVEQALEMTTRFAGSDLAPVALSFGARLRLMRGQAEPLPLPLAPSMREDPFVLYLPVELPRLTEARRLMRSARPADLSEAQRILEDAVLFLTQSRVVISLVPALCLQALLYRMREQKGRALSTLAQAVEMGTPGGFVRAFLDCGPELTGLLYELRLTGAAADHVSTILAAAAHEPSNGARAKQAETPVEPLTTRELAVLELLVRGLSDKEIAQALVISPLTVRKHTGNIFDKLQVRNRREAAARAVELGLARAK